VRFRRQILRWFDRHGRKDLPWQTDPTPYRVWISEIMLQQTQVVTVMPYFKRFIARFGDVASLAAAPLDEVLHLWSGLGYYARARNLHRAARTIVDAHAGRLPMCLDALRDLPGIGRSTAGAILALAGGQRQPILDGNVKRVLSRYAMIAGWYGERAVEQRLWALSAHLTPQRRVAEYTQAMMDLGATVCTRTQPDCDRCPLRNGCLAKNNGRVGELPTPRPRRSLPVRQTRFLLLDDGAGGVLLERRPPAGIWGGLWSFPEVPEDAEPGQWCREQLQCRIGRVQVWPAQRHSFTHFHLDITPLYARLKTTDLTVLAQDRAVWYNTRSPDHRGLAAPVQRLLTEFGRLSRGDST
jgi:A/G-specific adenine glycosylase